INTTFIYVTHDQTEAMTLGDRIVIMKDGEVQQIGTPQEVFNNPVNTFVAGFIGMPQMNMFDGKLIKKNGKYAVQVGEAVIVPSEAKQQHLAERNTPEMDILVGARPEHITLDQVDGAMITGKVDVSEMMGSSVHLHINADGKDCIIIVPTLDLKDDALSIGSTVKFTFAPNAVHMFDPETGKNLEYR
ncbi:MAG: TOBE domain-containing protein, partial [Solobacterium sp.]|nr:TOBE domain-containing protein [Solobacterium sp.]